LRNHSRAGGGLRLLEWLTDEGQIVLVKNSSVKNMRFRDAVLRIFVSIVRSEVFDNFHAIIIKIYSSIWN
jgi:hypothetical protein